MTDQLWIGDDFALPRQAVTETFAILAKRGSGKSYTASVMAEEMIAAGLPVCVIDPVGSWWGLRSSADGLSPGLPVVIFGGEHGDLPLSHDQGELLARIVVDEHITAVLDLMLMSKTQQRRFVCGFMEYLYRHNRTPLHLFVDEADLFAPQRGTADTARLLGAYEDVVRRGRRRGLGCTSITQRPASLHKDILSQSEVLIALRMTGVHDYAAINAWVQMHADDEQARQVKESLASLPVGTAWIWSPGWLEVLQKVQIRQRLTFDSGATPAAGAQLLEPVEWAKVDLDQLRELLTADGPADAPAASAADGEVARLHRDVDRLTRELAAERAKPAQVVQVVPAQALADLAGVAARLTELIAALPRSDRPAPAALAAQARPARTPQVTRQPAAQQPAAQQPAGSSLAPGQGAGLKAGARRMLSVLARQHPLRVTRAQLGTLSGLRTSGGTFGTYYSELRRRQLIIEESGLVGVTPRGFEVAGVSVANTPMTTDELREQWFGVLKAGARAMLQTVIDVYPQSMTREQLATEVGLEPRGGTFGTYLGNLRSNGLIDVTGPDVRAAEVFFLAPATHP